jgi:hypothetical protein
MKIKFTGEIEIPDGADDRGTVDFWVIQTIEQIIQDGPESDDIYDKLKLTWDITE